MNIEELAEQKIELSKLKSEIKDILAQKAEAVKIKDEIADLLAQKIEIVKEMNAPIVKAKAEAEKINKDAKDEAQVTISAANKILAEAQAKHTETLNLLHATKGDIEKFKSDRAKLEQEKTDLDGLRFAHENVIRQQRNSTSQIEAQNRADTERLQQGLIEVKQREDSLTRRENGLKTAENSLNELKDTLETRKSNLDALEAKLSLLEKTLAEQKDSILFREKELLVIKAETDSTAKRNQALLEEAIMRKSELVNQQKSLAREVEILDNAKAENDEMVKTLKEKERIIDLKLRQNQEKLDTIKKLRGE